MEIQVIRAVARLSAVGGKGKEGAIENNFLNFKNNLQKNQKIFNKFTIYLRNI